MSCQLSLHLLNLRYLHKFEAHPTRTKVSSDKQGTGPIGYTRVCRAQIRRNLVNFRTEKKKGNPLVD